MNSKLRISFMGQVENSGSRFTPAIIGLWLVLLSPRPALPEQTGPFPPPSKAAADEAASIIHDLYKKEYASRTPDERTAFGRTLLKQGIDSGGDVTARYVLLREARDVAAGVGDVATAIKAQDVLAAGYTGYTIADKAALVTTLGKSVRSATEARQLVVAVMTLMDEAVESDQYDLARQVGNNAVTVSRKANNAGLVTAAQARVKDIEIVRREFEKIKPAIATLRDSPEDLDARLAVGRFYCILKHDYERGLKWLESCSDADLEAMARLDLKSPAEAMEQFRIGEGWYEYATRQREPDKTIWFSRASFWFAKAIPHLDGLTKLRADAKLKEIAKQDAGGDQVATKEVLVTTVTQSRWQIRWSNGNLSPILSVTPDGRLEYPGWGQGHWRVEGVALIFEFPNGESERHFLKAGRLVSEHFAKGATVPEKTGIGTPVP